MSLKLYKQKRDFNNTPEPSGNLNNHSGLLKFVVQKHDASHLHYDFRLEADGVLKSWAVPKGPSTDPNIKRLAMMVEDHPYEYRNFEGVIPKGNYGAGKAIIWDQGNYEAIENTKDSDNEIQKEIFKGSIKIRLFGQKLKGAWALIKLKNSEENSWLLIKEKDEFASDKEITINDKSVISGLSVDDISGQRENQDSLLFQLPKDTPPKFIKPMLASLVKQAFNDKDWIYEIKWDGYRALADIRKENVNLYSRNKISFNKEYQLIVKELSKVDKEMVLDGEIVILDEDGKPNFGKLQNYKNEKPENLVYYIFDLLYLDNRKLINLPLIERKKWLNRNISESNSIKISPFIEGNGIDFFEAAKKQNLEGIIAKRKDSLYEIGARSKSWLKIKTYNSQEAIICGYTQPRNGRKYFGALILGIYKNGSLIYVGHTGSGFDENILSQIYKLLEKLKIDKSPFKSAPKTNMPATWVKPKLICEVTFSEWTPGGHMRHPVFKGLRFDKLAKSVDREKSLEKLIKTKNFKSNFYGIKVSNINKIYWPKEGITKGDLLEYYQSISKFILPYLKNRPQSLRRYPDGVNDQGFFQKNINAKVPEFVETIKLHSDHEDREINYLVCQNIETLIYMVNLGCIDINPWSSRIDNLDNPDYIIFDLDPLNISFEKVIETALEVRNVLEKIEIKSFPKTSGATGIHIYVPTGGKIFL